MQHPWISSALATTPDQQQEQQQQSNQVLEDDYNVEVDTLERAAQQVDPHLEDDDDDLAMIYQYMRTNPTMDSQRVAASNIRKKQFIEHQFVKTMFGKGNNDHMLFIAIRWLISLL